MSLLDSARKFLVEGLEKYRRRDLDFAIIDAVAATELLMKERLRRIHPNLIYSDIDSPTIKRAKTVGLDHIPTRLRNLGIEILDQDLTLIHEVKHWRNQIIHHSADIPMDTAVSKLGRVFDFAGRFLVNELREDLKVFLPRELYKVADELMQEWQEVVRKARALAQKEGHDVVSLECPSCGGTRVVTRRDQGNAYCHLCEIDLLIGPCQFCKELTLTEVDAFSSGIYHWSCLDDYARDYFASLSEN